MRAKSQEFLKIDTKSNLGRAGYKINQSRQIRIPIAFFIRIEQTTLKFVRNHKRSHKAKEEQSWKQNAS